MKASTLGSALTKYIAMKGSSALGWNVYRFYRDSCDEVVMAFLYGLVVDSLTQYQGISSQEVV